jgi:hypothetical protein
MGTELLDSDKLDMAICQNSGVVRSPSSQRQRFEYPPFILFWTFRYKILSAALRRLGYTVTETSA